MLKLIRLSPTLDLFTVQGAGVQPGAIPIGSFSDAVGLLKKLGVPASECLVAREWLDQRPDHNAVEFGVAQLAVTTTLTVDLTLLHREIGCGPQGLPS